MRSFTLIEILITVAILVLLVGLSAPAIGLFQKTSDLAVSGQEIAGFLRSAQNKTLTLENGGQWGIYFSTSTSPHQYVLFQGPSFASSSFSEIKKLPDGIEIFQIDLAGKSETVFSKVSGQANPAGNIYLRLKNDQSKIAAVFIDSSGKIDFVNSSPSDQNRLKDSRHIHFDYSRVISISTSTDKFTLIFSDPPNPDVNQDIIIPDNLASGQISWQGNVVVAGETQTVKVETHRLNNPDTQFSIIRDKRYNTKAVSVTINGDASGNLIQYQADGQTATGTSIYVTTPIWQ